MHAKRCQLLNVNQFQYSIKKVKKMSWIDLVLAALFTRGTRNISNGTPCIHNQCESLRRCTDPQPRRVIPAVSTSLNHPIPLRHWRIIRITQNRKSTRSSWTQIDFTEQKWGTTHPLSNRSSWRDMRALGWRLWRWRRDCWTEKAEDDWLSRGGERKRGRNIVVGRLSAPRSPPPRSGRIKVLLKSSSEIWKDERTAPGR